MPNTTMFVYDFPLELPNDLRIGILGKTEILRKS